MIVRHFLQWVRTAEAAERAEATSALARAYLYSDLTQDDRIAAEGAMIMLLDDPSPLVRYALADAIGSSADAPAAVVHALVNDQPDIATVVRVADGETITTDGPFAETKEQLGGFWIISAADLDAALEWAAKGSAACMGPVEVRPFQDDTEA